MKTYKIPENETDQDKLIRHLKRATEEEVTDFYFSRTFPNIVDLKNSLALLHWTLDEFDQIESIQHYTANDPVVSIDRNEIQEIEKWLNGDKLVILTVEDSWTVVQNQTFSSFLDAVSELIMLRVDPDHHFIEGCDFHLEEIDGKEYAIGEVSLGS